jgi:hypothetical protein
MMVAQFASVELGGLLQNMRLMAQALGLGGFPNYAGTPGVWGKLLHFDQATTPYTKLLGMTAEQRKAYLAAGGVDFPYPVDISLTRKGKKYMKALTPPNYGGSGLATARAYVDFKFGPHGTLSDPAKGSAWKDPEAIRRAIPGYSEQLVHAIGDHIDYVYKKYGRFPAGTGPLGHLTAFQAHVLDADFYKTYYKEGILTETQNCRSEH